MTQVTEHLQTRGVPFEAIAHQQTYTSIAEARALGIDASEVLKQHEQVTTLPLIKHADENDKDWRR